MKHEQVIYGCVPSKSNLYEIIRINGKASMRKSRSMKDYEEKFFLQCGVYRNRRIQGFFELYADVYFQSNQPDLDNSLKGLLDCLQGCNAIKNDRQCVKIVANKFVDKRNPRIEFTLREVGGVEVRDSAEPGLFD